MAVRIALLIAIAAVVCPGRSSGQDAIFQQQENVVYGETNGVGLLLDVFTPTGDKNGLAIVDVISGAWHSDRGKIRDHARAQSFQILCRKGYVVFAIRPGSITKFSAPEMIEHLNQGIRWVKVHAPEHEIDPDRLGLMGASAGGHLASLAAVTADNEANAAGRNEPSVSTRVKAVAVFFPPTDFLDYGGKAVDPNSDQRMGQLLRQLAFPRGLDGMSPEEMTRKITEISPARRVTLNAPPFLLIHGDADPVVPLQQSEVMLAALRKCEVSADLIVKPGGAHPWPTLHEEVEILADWFDKQLESR